MTCSPTLEGWWAEGRPVALATVVGTFRSAPRQPGASMLVGADGQAVGSVSGGCVEGAVYELGSGRSSRAPTTRRCSATASPTTTRSPSA